MVKGILARAILEYLKFFAKLRLAQINPTIIGVTGSAGKSSCVAAIEAVLKDKYKVKTTGTTNSESGIPLAILDLKLVDYSQLDWLRVFVLAPVQIIKFLIHTSKFEILVCEMGIDELTPPKNIGYLLTIVKPTVGVFLNVLPVHTQQMKSVENIAKEKGKLISSLPANGTAVLNASDEEVMKFSKKTVATVVTFKDDLTPIPPAMAVAKVFGLDETQARESLKKNLRMPPGRDTVLAGIYDSMIIDSSYNASPIPMFAALDQLKKVPGKRKVAVLGDMRELGDLAEKYHQLVGHKAVESADQIITVGPLSKAYYQKSKKLAGQFDNFHQAGNFLQSFIKPGDVILFKGSQNTIFLEGAIEMCLKNKSDAAELCRRGKFWEKQRQKIIRGDAESNSLNANESGPKPQRTSV